MAKIVDPDQLNQGTEVVIDTGAKTVQLVVAGNLDDNAPGQTSGVTLQALYSFLKEEWKDDATLNKFRFPIKAIFNASFIWQNNWAPADAQTRDLIRDAGWEEVDGSAYAGIISLGSMDDSAADLAYYIQTESFTATTTDFDKTGELNEPIQILGAGGTPDNTGYLKVFLREQGKTYATYALLAEQGLGALDSVVYRLPLANATDIDITETDANIDANVPYTGMTLSFLKGSGFTTWANATAYPAGAVVLDPIRQSGGSTNGTWWFTPGGGTTSGTGTADDTGITDWESYAGEIQIGSEWYAFNRIVDGNGGTKGEIYNWLQRILRLTTDINDNLLGGPNQNGFGAVNGEVAADLGGFVGSVLHSAGGVGITNFDVNDTNDIVMHDITVDGGGLDSESVPLTDTARPFPFVSAGTISFSQNLVDEPDVDTIYRMYFLNDDAGDNLGNDFDTANAIVVNDNGGSPIEGQITAADIAFDYDYDGNTQRGAGSAGTDAPVVVVAQALDGAEWIEAQATITRATGISIPVNAPDERNYLNPA